MISDANTTGSVRIRQAAVLALWLWLVPCGRVPVVAAPDYPGYRDLTVWTTNTNDPARPETIVARTQFTNRGAKPLQVSARLQPSPALGFAGAKYSARLPPGETNAWSWSFTPPAGVARKVLSGEIALDGRPERDLFVAVQGADPAGAANQFVDPLTERARVVATFSPRQRRSVLAQIARNKASQPKPVLTLAKDSQSRYVIHTEALPAPPEGQEPLVFWRGLKTLTPSQQELVAALDDLQRILRLKTGATLPIGSRAEGPAILLRLADPGPAAAGLHDAYRLRTAGGNVVIEAAGLDGLRNGVYGLLTDHLDCHWFTPGELGEEIGLPADRAARLPALDEVRGSRWFSAHGSLRNRATINRGRMNFGHAWYSYINEQEYPYEKFPEYYARDRAGNILKFDKGYSFTGFCSTNPDVLAIVARKVNAFFANNPDAIVVSLDPNDYAPMCLCDRCLALDKQYGQTKEDGTAVADRLLHFSKEIHDRLEPRFKDRYLGILIYAYQMAPPVSAKGHPHHVGMICDMFWEYDHSRPWSDPTSPRNRIFREQLAAWGRAVSQLGYYEYTGNAEFFGPWGLVHKLREDLPAFHALGGTFLAPEAQGFWATQGLNLYISDRLSWDLDADVDWLLEEYFTRFYGPAAEPMRAYWMAIERQYNLARPGTRLERRLYNEPSAWEELAGYLRQAAAITAKLPPAQKRFADRVQFTRDGLEFGRLTAEYGQRFEHQQADHAAAIAFLEQHGPRVKELTTRYGSGGSYWPPLAPSWAIAHRNFEVLLAQHRQALGK